MVKYDVLKGFYDLERTIGCGGFAKVKLATHLATGEKVAIKIMEKQALKDDLPRVRLELKALKSMSHPHVCKLYQVIETETHYFIVIEYCSGGELFDHIVEKSKLSEKESRKFFRQILSAVAYLHGLGYAHRDLKPENVLLDHGQNLKLIDFGLCAKPDGGVENPLYTSCGSPTYAAPELIQGKQYLGPEVDVWAMGILLFALLCGYLPFDDENIQALYRKILNGKYQEPHFLSQSSRRLIRQMLQVDPKKRITVKGLLMHPWVTADSPEEIKVNTDFHKDPDEDIVALMAQYHNATSDDLWKHIKKWKYDYNTATYMLLLGRRNRGLPLRILSGALKQPIRIRSAEAVGTPNTHKTPMRPLSGLQIPLRNRAIQQCEGAPIVPAIRLIDPYINSRKLDLDKDDLLSPKIIGVSPDNILECRKPSSIRKPMKRIRSPNLDIENSPVPIKRTPGRSVSKTPEWNNNSTPASAEISSARKVLGNIERSLNRVRHVLTPRSKASPAGPSILTNKDLCNVSTTQCSDPDYVITELIKGLQRKGIECRRKGFAIRGKMESSNGGKFNSGCSFELEICFLPSMTLTPSRKGSTPSKCCSHGTPTSRASGNLRKRSGSGNFTVKKMPQLVGIRRKRLKGDSWCYKKVCEQVLALTSTELKQTAV